MTTTSSHRRTGRITNPRGYVVIKIDYLAATTNSIRCTACQDLHLTGTHGAYVDIKAGEIFYLIRSESLGDNLFYIVLTDDYGIRSCSCPATADCKHKDRLYPIVASWLPDRRPLSPTADELAAYEELIDDLPPLPTPTFPTRPAKPTTAHRVTATAQPQHTTDEVHGTLSSAAHGSFLDVVFGSSSMRQAFVARGGAR
jgi:hypothetical protein